MTALRNAWGAQRLPSRALQAVAYGWLLAAWCATAAAQTFYKWTDDHGIVHFSDQAPLRAQGVEERHLPPPVSAGEEGQQPAAGEGSGGEGGGNAPASGTPAATGPARVVVVSHRSPRTGPSAMHILGKVKNVGGGDAQRVAVSISAVDSNQGNPCLQDEVPVTPSTLHPGETGNFDTDIDSPCLFGDAKVDVGPIWE